MVNISQSEALNKRTFNDYDISELAFNLEVSIRDLLVAEILRDELSLSRVTEVEAVEDDLKVPLLCFSKLTQLNPLHFRLHDSSDLLLFFCVLAGFYLFAMLLNFTFQPVYILVLIGLLTATLGITLRVSV